MDIGHWKIDIYEIIIRKKTFLVESLVVTPSLFLPSFSIFSKCLAEETGRGLMVLLSLFKHSSVHLV